MTTSDAPAPIVPERTRTLRELRLVREPVRLFLASPQVTAPMLRRSTTTARRVMTLPGFGATDRSMTPLRGYLHGLGHSPIKWGLGRNNGDVQRMVEETNERISDLTTDEPIDLIGWSLGGVVAREVARDQPTRVRSVITYGTPVIGGPRYTVSAKSFGEEAITAIEAEIVVRERTPITVPVTAIYSRQDGIVDWPACIDPYPNNVEHIEVSSSHIGMGIDPDVWRLIAERLGS